MSSHGVELRRTHITAMCVILGMRPNFLLGRAVDLALLLLGTVLRRTVNRYGWLNSPTFGNQRGRWHSTHVRAG